MRKVDKKYQFDLSDSCLCGSGRTIQSCHLDWDGKLRKRVPNLQPRGNVTEYSHQKCYLSSTRNCCTKITAEHYISESVIEQLGRRLVVDGMPWLENGKSIEISTSSLTAKILCNRHNSSLSDLDNEAALFFKHLISAISATSSKSLSRKHEFHLVSGDMIELWMLKVCCGTYYSVASNQGLKTFTTHTIDMQKVIAALYEGRWDKLGGLYLHAHIGEAVRTAGEIVVTSLLSETRKAVCGLKIELLGFVMEMLFDTIDVAPPPWDGLVRRPTEILFENGNRGYHIALTWRPNTPEQSVRFNTSRYAR